MDSTNLVVVVEATRNDGFYHRRALALAAQSCEFDMMGRLHADIFFQEPYMINEIGVKIKLVRSKDAFCVMGAANAKCRSYTHLCLYERLN